LPSPTTFSAPSRPASNLPDSDWRLHHQWAMYRAPNNLPFSKTMLARLSMADWLVDAIDVRSERLFAACHSFSWLTGAIGPLEEAIARRRLHGGVMVLGRPALFPCFAMGQNWLLLLCYGD